MHTVFLRGHLLVTSLGGLFNVGFLLRRYSSVGLFIWRCHIGLKALFCFGFFFLRTHVQSLKNQNKTEQQKTGLFTSNHKSAAAALLSVLFVVQQQCDQPTKDRTDLLLMNGSHTLICSTVQIYHVCS